MKNKLNFKNKVIWALFLIVIVSAVGIYGKSLFVNEIKGKSTARVSFNFEGIDQGLNPQGGVFDAQAMKSQKVLTNAIEKLEWDEDKVDIQTLASHIIIKGIVPGDVMGRIMPKISEDKDFQMEKVAGASYHPTQYQIALSLSRDMNLSNEEANLLLDAIIESYSEYFVERYKDTQVIDGIITKIDPEKYDYSEYVELVAGQLDVMKSYLSDKEQISKDYRSTSTNQSFGDLIAELELIEDVQLGNVKSLLDSFVITKDIQKSEIVYKNMINRMNKESEKYRQEAQVLKNIARDYKKDKQVILGSGTTLSDLDNELKKDLDEEDEQSLYDSLIEQSIQVENRANKMEKQAKRYEALLANINAQKENGSSVDVQSYHAEVEQNIEYISGQMEEAMESIKLVVDDYYENEVFSDSITLLNKPRYVSSFRMNLIKDTMKVAAIGFIMLIIGLISYLAKKETND
ncbi:MAG: hypothetical protein GX366_05550 [Epulopiscium sp.]|nr:hypothetical protein [Candidatus Epulonipiscium sp.]